MLPKTPRVSKNGPANLNKNLRYLRHLSSVCGRNLAINSNSLKHCYFTLHEIVQINETEEGVLEEPFYLSEIIYYCNNPQWSTLPKFHPSLSLQKFFLVIWECSTSPLSIVVQQEIILSNLRFIENEDFVFPQNTLIFKLFDGIYVLQETRKHLIETNQIKYISTSLKNQQNTMKSSLSRKDFLNILSKKLEIQSKKEHHQFLLCTIEQKLERKRAYFALIKQRDEMRDQVNQLREEYQRTKEIIELEKTEVLEMKATLLPRANQLTAQNKELDVKQRHLNIFIEKWKQKKLEYNKTMFYLKRDVLELVHQLKLIYSINNVKADYWTICGFHLPNTEYGGHDEELIAVAFGHVCHLILLLAKYLDVPLRYQMIPRCSRSLVVEDASSKIPYPLYSKGVDKERFITGVTLLTKNLEQLLHSQKVEPKQSRDILPNLHSLLTYLEEERELLLSKKSDQYKTLI